MIDKKHVDIIITITEVLNEKQGRLFFDAAKNAKTGCREPP